MPPVLSQADQAQVQMSQQMQQMMQLQMQWMQQMMQIQGAQQSPGQSATAQIVPVPGGSPNHLQPANQTRRPMSMLSMPSIPVASSPMQGQRSMSTLSPSMASWNKPAPLVPQINFDGGPGYAPSIAPSERSNVGLASRYRPVSTAPEQNESALDRSSTFTSGTFTPWGSDVSVRKSPSPSPAIRMGAHAEKKVPAVPDDEDDDRGWMEMKLQRDKKKSAWKKNKAQNGLEDVYHGGL